MRHRPKRPPRPKNNEPTPFDSIRVFLPHSDKKLLADFSAKLGLQQSRLMAMAFDNEMDQKVPFHYPCTLPTAQYIEGAYTNEASKLLRFMDNFRYGVGRDMLMLCRREMGIPSRETLMLAYRELLENNMIIEVDPPKSEKNPYLPGYKLAMLRTEDQKRMALARQKRAEIERLELEAKELERGI